jgi:hypothetical protein
MSERRRGGSDEHRRRAGRTSREIDWTHAIDIGPEDDWRLAEALMGRT